MKDKTRDITLGNRVKDKITGFTGIATSEFRSITGPVRYAVETASDFSASAKGNTEHEERWFDRDRLEYVDEGIIEPAAVGTEALTDKAPFNAMSDFDPMNTNLDKDRIFVLSGALKQTLCAMIAPAETARPVWDETKRLGLEALRDHGTESMSAFATTVIEQGKSAVEREFGSPGANSAIAPDHYTQVERDDLPPIGEPVVDTTPTRLVGTEREVPPPCDKLYRDNEIDSDDRPIEPGDAVVISESAFKLLGIVPLSDAVRGATITVVSVFDGKARLSFSGEGVEPGYLEGIDFDVADLSRLSDVFKAIEERSDEMLDLERGSQQDAERE